MLGASARRRVVSLAMLRAVSCHRSASTSGWAQSQEVRAFARSMDEHGAIVEAVVAARGAEGYASPCPVVGASVGAHLRHSLEHARCCADAVAALRAGEAAPVARYDARERDEALETDPARAVAYGAAVRDAVLAGAGLDLDAAVRAAFALSADAADGDVALPSTVRRELAFVAHHATHHFAMINLIAKGHLAMDLREGLGRAPATRRDDAAKHKR